MSAYDYAACGFFTAGCILVAIVVGMTGGWMAVLIWMAFVCFVLAYGACEAREADIKKESNS